MNDPFKVRVAANPVDQNYLELAYDKWKRRKHRDHAMIAVFIHHETGRRRHRIMSRGSFRASMMRVGESAHTLAHFDRSGGVLIEAEFSAETDWYREFIASYQQGESAS